MWGIKHIHLTYALAALLIVAAALVVYRGVLFPPDPQMRYPWSSDAWGHLIKAEYLREQMAQGAWYPDLFPHWYSGQQMLRYYAPLPYYLLVGLLPLASDVFAAGNWFLFLAALAGGLSMLLYAGRFGLAFAALGGVLLVLLPDNLRVAFAEGNLPRVLAAAFLPATFYFLLNLLTGERHRRLSFAAMAGLLCLIVLSHAMMGAIFNACLVLFAIVSWLVGRAETRYVGQAILGILTGVMLAGWWLLPSLTGGITELNAEAASESLASIPWNISLNPAVRGSNQEAFYIGASLVLPLALMLFYWRRVDGVMKSLFVVGFITVAISSTLVNGVYSSLPFHQLFWPLRFMSFSGFILALFAVALLSRAWRLSGPRWQSLGRFAAIGLALLMLLDFWQSAPLARTREAPPEVMQVARMLRDSDGWRVATADLSLLGSAPSYLFSAAGGKEQVYGWAYQGAITAPLLARINQAIEKGFTGYAVDRLERLGSDDVVVLKTPPQAIYQVSEEFYEALPSAGYEMTLEGSRVDVYQKRGSPRAYQVDTRIFAIGSGAQNLALLFSEVMAGSSTTLDSYEIEFLAQFDMLVLAGFDWNDKGTAEDMVRQLASGGQRVIIDLTGTPLDVLARIPRFLDVYGERILLSEPPSLPVNGEIKRLRPFDQQYQPWQAYVPQGLDEKRLTFGFNGAEAVVVGSKEVGNGSVTFLGLNLMFHSVLTRDPAAIEILEQQLGVKANSRPNMAPVPMEGYTAAQDGYRFSLDAPESGLYLIPVAHHSGTVIYMDGEEIPSLAVETLSLVELPTGRHNIEIASRRTLIYPIGMAATALGLLIVAVTLLGGVRFSAKGFTFIPKEHRVPLPGLGALHRLFHG